MLSDGAMRSLALVRYLHAQAIEQERKGDLLAGLALLPLHDAIELFPSGLRLGEKDVPVGANEAFLAYWSAFEESRVSAATQKTQMDGFNRARVEVKHRGALHAQHVVARSIEAMATEFLELMSPSPTLWRRVPRNLIVRLGAGERRAQRFARRGEGFFARRDLAAAILNSALAFRRALHNFRVGDPPKSWDQRLFDPTSIVNFQRRKVFVFRVPPSTRSSPEPLAKRSSGSMRQ